MDKLGKLVRERIDKHGDSIKAMARKIKCSEAFAKHIISSRSVPVSRRLMEEIIKQYNVQRKKLEAAALIRNRVGRKYYAEYRKKTT